MNCSNHPETESAGFCSSCGKAVCADCMGENGVCKVCIATGQPAAQPVQPEQPNAGQPAQPQQPVQPEQGQPQQAGQPVINVINNNGVNYGPQKEKMVTLILCIFLGYFGIHRFYTGKIGTGILWLLTGGLCGIGIIVDIIMIATGSFTDNFNRPLV